MININAETFFIENTHRKDSNYHSILLNIGNCSTNIVSKSCLSRFPSFVTKSNSNSAENGSTKEDLILYMDENGQEWIIGSHAKKALIDENALKDPLEVYEQSRWDDPTTLIMLRVSIAAGIRKSNGSHAAEPIQVQAVLPPSYYETDVSVISKKIIGNHSYKVKFGKGDWEDFDYELNASNLILSNQPDEIQCSYFNN